MLEVDFKFNSTPQNRFVKRGLHHIRPYAEYIRAWN